MRVRTKEGHLSGSGTPRPRPAGQQAADRAYGWTYVRRGRPGTATRPSRWHGQRDGVAVTGGLVAPGAGSGEARGTISRTADGADGRAVAPVSGNSTLTLG
ncbi:hypothetical protein GCM10009801_73970 [Streptomyces albiaxialis]|uniref:Uncharacterized protein n=1 Tax=Streptomyces albiaxialis TaxID=329523 RepID=A0ABP5ILP9_9ACTN